MLCWHSVWGSPAYGQVRVSNELRKAGVFISPSGVRSIWLRHGQQSFKRRVAALEKHIAETCAVLTESQIQALEKKQDDDAAHGEIEASENRGCPIKSELLQLTNGWSNTTWSAQLRG